MNEWCTLREEKRRKGKKREKDKKNFNFFHLILSKFVSNNTKLP